MRALVNFNGGVQIPACGTNRRALVAAAGAFAANTDVPAIWFYGDTDSLFPPDLWRAMFASYARHRDTAELVDVGGALSDSHQFLGDPATRAAWVPRLDAFLARAGLPAVLVNADYLPPRYPPASGYAAVGDVDRLPFATDRSRAFYRAWLGHPTPRVIALSATGKMSAAFGGFDPASQALNECAGQDGAMCRLYAIDGDVVWQPLPPPPPASNHAALTDAAAIPYLPATKTAFLARFLGRPAPRALVVARDGRAFGSYGSHAWEQAWINCTAVAARCEPYIVDDAVVWQAGLYADVAGPGFHARRPPRPAVVAPAGD